jgi:peptidoglycan hydrolase-like protein with peptidoglycan-binding domain
MRALAAAAALAAVLALPAHAAAQTPPLPVPTPTPVPAPAPTPPPAPAAGTLTLAPQGVFGGSKPIALRGHAFTVRGVLRPYVAGEKVIVRVYRNGKKIRAKAVTPKPIAGGAAGVLTLKIGDNTPGKLTIKASHAQSPALATLRAKTIRVQVLRASASFGSSGPVVRLLQGKLAALHFVVPRSGVFDAGTSRAVIAYRKLTGMARIGTASEDVFTALLKGRGVFKVRHPKDGHHVEARLNQQVLALINGSKVERIYMMSSGKPSTPTVQGRFAVYSKTPGTNAKGMVDSNYFIRGYAIHGYADVPVYNASHGCLRVPVPDAASIYNWLRLGDVVWVEP